MSAAVARAQPPTEVPTSAAPQQGAAGPDPASPPSSREQPAAGTPLDTAALVAELASQKRELEEEKKALEAAKKRVDRLASRADAAQAPTEGDTEDRFKIYGFTDVGVQRVWIDPSTAAAQFLNSSNATSFVVGDLDLYLDAKPVKNWRSLVEIRFTNAPQGLVTGVGGPGGTFTRPSTRQPDPNSRSLAAHR